jgi:hypothetical protein
MADDRGLDDGGRSRRVAIAALLPGALISGGNPINNPQSQRARDAVRRDFPATAGAATTDIIIVSSQRYSVDAPRSGHSCAASQARPAARRA